MRNGEGFGRRKRICSSKIVQYDVTGAPRTEKRKERIEIKSSRER